eukprot:Sspe_Gene.89669::Locus_61388_Transcript_1_1_Confidence_1.000_Length_2213::g.89669::m.89669/K00784/rnz; ribonuclease Z
MDTTSSFLTCKLCTVSELPKVAKQPVVLHEAPNVSILGIPDPQNPHTAAYVVVIPQQPGRFLADKADALGVKGKKRAALKAGESVYSDADPTRLVTPEEVLGPPVPAKHYLVVDSYGAVPCLADCARTQGFNLQCVIHLTPPSSITEAYQKEYDTAFQGVPQVYGSCDAATCFHSSAQHHDRLHHFSPALFPKEVTTWEGRTAHPVVPSFSPVPPLTIINLVGGQSTAEGFDKKECRAQLDLQTVRSEWPESLTKAMEEAREKAPCLSEGVLDTPQATFLGTGGMMPSKYRSVTAILLRYPTAGGSRSILFDSGEGTLGQLRRTADLAVLAELEAIWISHLHADHHVGLPTILVHRARVLAERDPGVAIPPIRVFCPGDLITYLDKYSNDVAPLYCECTPCKAETVTVGSVTVTNVPVVHCKDAWGCVVKGAVPRPWTVVYSGDTRPCPALVEAAPECDLLIHEATFEDEREEDAIAKNHCTVADALGVARDMNAKCTMLTHFSQRYPKVPPTTDNSGKVGNVGLAFDLMTVRIQDGERLEALKGPLRVLEQYYDEQEAAKKAAVEPAPPKTDGRKSKKRTREAGPPATSE